MSTEWLLGTLPIPDVESVILDFDAADVDVSGAFAVGEDEGS